MRRCSLVVDLLEERRRRELVYEYFILFSPLISHVSCVWNLVSNDARNARPYRRWSISAIWTWRTPRRVFSLSLALSMRSRCGWPCARMEKTPFTTCDGGSDARDSADEEEEVARIFPRESREIHSRHQCVSIGSHEVKVGGTFFCVRRRRIKRRVVEILGSRHSCIVGGPPREAKGLSVLFSYRPLHVIYINVYMCHTVYLCVPCIL